jgi:hypothetical protein
MKIKKKKLQAEDLQELLHRGIQPSQQWVKALFENPHWFKAMSQAGSCAAFSDERGITAIAGIVNFGATGRGMVWAIFAYDSGKHFVSLYRKMRLSMLSCGLKRYEAYIKPEFREAVRMAKIAGFKYEGLMVKHENGQDRELWALT